MRESVADRVKYYIKTAVTVIEASPREGDFEHEGDPAYFRGDLYFGAIPEIREILETSFDTVYQVHRGNPKKLGKMFFNDVQDAFNQKKEKGSDNPLGKIDLDNELTRQVLIDTAVGLEPLWEDYMLGK